MLAALHDSVNNELPAIFSRAQMGTLMLVSSRLTLDEKGAVEKTAKNLGVYKDFPKIFSSNLSEGLHILLTNVFDSMLKNIPAIEELAGKVAAFHGVEAPQVEQKELALVRQNLLGLIQDAVTRAGMAAKREGGLSLGHPIPWHSLLDRLQSGLNPVKDLTHTAISVFNRSMIDTALAKIDSALEQDGRAIRYTYVGTPASRGFCDKLLRQAAEGRTWTRDQIERMDNGVLGSAIRMGGGYNCQHEWRPIWS